MILFLDDSPARRRSAVTYMHGVHTTDRARLAISALEDQRFREAYLDHDLGGESDDPATEDADGLTGMHVARWIALNRTDLRVVVHSLNGPAAERMAGVLRDAGVSVDVVPFTALLDAWRLR